MLRYTDGWEVMIVNTLGTWYALVSKDGKTVNELLGCFQDREDMVQYAKKVMGYIGVTQIN